MLSRVADNIYWMSRYLERASNIARFIEVNEYLLLDLPEPTGGAWEPLIHITGDYAIFKDQYGEVSRDHALQFLTFDRDYPNSIIFCLMAARENARTVRENISEDLWEAINIFYHLVLQASRGGFTDDQSAFEFFRTVKQKGMLLGGIAQETMTLGEEFHFFRLGRLLERAEKTSRLLDVKYFLLLPSVEMVGTPYDDIQWAALLGSLGAVETYRRRFGRINPREVVQLLVLDMDFPRSILSCLTRANESLHAVTGSRSGAYRNVAEQRLGQLCADLSFKSLDQIFDQGLHEFIDGLQVVINEVDTAIFDTFFALPSGGEQGAQQE